MTLITSRQNPIFKRVREALREHRDEIVIEGPKFVADAIAAGWKPIVVLHRSSVDERFADRGSQFAVSSALFDSLAETQTPQNVIGLFQRPTANRELRTANGVIVALDGVQDPGNVGTIVRLAAAFDCGGVVLLPGTADAFSSKAIRASAGAVLSVPVLNMTAEQLIGLGMSLFAADAHPPKAAAWPPHSKSVLVLGSEGAGVSDTIRKVATPVAIPMSSRVESLNVAASAAILLSKAYEARRGR